jgi:hypothetical protein
MVKSLSVIGLSVLLAMPAAAAAQFTSVVVPPRAERTAAQAAARPTTPAAADSAARVAMSDMRSWVDSAATALGAQAPRPRLADDTLFRDTAAVAPARRPPPAAQMPARVSGQQGTQAFREGAPAPATATPLPFIALLGFAGFGAGLLLLRKRA